MDNKSERDIFEDVRKSVGCDYISDLPYMRKRVLRILDKIDFREYPAGKVKEFICYLYSRNS